MSRPHFRRFLILLLLALVVFWPASDPAHADQVSLATSAPIVDGHDRDAARGSCPAEFCCTPPAILPASSPDHADAGRPVAFSLASDRGEGRTPGVSTPPPKMALLA